MTNKKISTGINGFGRFGLHLLKYYLDRSEESNYSIDYINDNILSIKAAVEIIKADEAVSFSNYKFRIEGDDILISRPPGDTFRIQFSTSSTDINSISWLGEPDLILECSGRFAEFPDQCNSYLIGNTKHVAISATSFGSDKTLVYAYNHHEFDPEKHKIVSYGSCTVNAYFVLADFINKKYGVHNSDVSVTHNMQGYKLDDPHNHILFRKGCTLEKSAPLLMDFVTSENFFVDYIVGPFTNVSAISFRFEVKNKVERDELVKTMVDACHKGELEGLYDVEEVFLGDSNAYNCTPFSSVFTKDGINVRGNNIYLQGYFDNENSVNRYYDLSQYIAEKM